jgi:hypothetical protein
MLQGKQHNLVQMLCVSPASHAAATTTRVQEEDQSRQHHHAKRPGWTSLDVKRALEEADNDNDDDAEDDDDGHNTSAAHGISTAGAGCVLEQGKNADDEEEEKGEALPPAVRRFGECLSALLDGGVGVAELNAREPDTGE